MTHTGDSRAPYAVRSDQHGGRLYPEPEDPLRSAFALDRHRIVESTAFRRLEQKTQVFAPSFGDHIRTRLTHTLEAALIARTLAEALRAEETLAETITLAHDLGHPPFGHAGEVALSSIMENFGGFNHNAHSLRVVEYLEHPFPPFRGLNLTGATRDGLRAHATRYDLPADAPPAGSQKDPPAAHREPGLKDRESAATPTRPGPSVEAQIASVADRVAYNCHDLEDAIGAGLVTLNDLAALPIWQRAYRAHEATTAGASIHAVRRVVLDSMLNQALEDVVDYARARLAEVTSPEQVKETPGALVTPTPEMDHALTTLEDFLQMRVYRHPDVARTDKEGQAMIRRLFDCYLDDPSRMPKRFSLRIAEQGSHRVICDYIAGMTDRFCVREHDRLMGG